MNDAVDGFSVDFLSWLGEQTLLGTNQTNGSGSNHFTLLVSSVARKETRKSPKYCWNKVSKCCFFNLPRSLAIWEKTKIEKKRANLKGSAQEQASSSCRTLHFSQTDFSPPVQSVGAVAAIYDLKIICHSCALPENHTISPWKREATDLSGRRQYKKQKENGEKWFVYSPILFGQWQALISVT